MLPLGPAGSGATVWGERASASERGGGQQICLSPLPPSFRYVTSVGGHYWSGQVGGCYWACVIGPFDDDDIDAFVAGIHRIGQSRLPEIAILDITYDIGLPKATARQKLAEAVAAQPNMHRVKAHAVVCDSPVARAVVTAINWLVRPKWPETMHSRPRDAVRWINEHTVVDEVAVMADIASKVPRFGSLRW